MSAVAIKVDEQAATPRVGPVSSTQPSKLFSGLFRMVDVNHRLTVLEIGPALTETVDFFSQFKCRLHFADLFHEPFVREQQARLSEKELRHAFEEQFRFPEGTKIDICLMWDFLCYLDDPALRAFNSALRPWLHPGTRAHGFGVHHLAIRLENIQYGVKDKETLNIRKRRSAQLPYHPHSQIEMHEMLNCFDFERGLLLPEGKLEMLLKPRT
jgi:hypothetical protein